MAQQPLAGVRIIDLTHALAGPFCTHHLQLMGAEVIKVEPPHGDDFREREGAFAAANAGKKSVVLDIKTEPGRELLYRLVKTGDVLVENYRPGVAGKLGLGWETLKGINPRLIFCSISGYGQDGPLQAMPAIESSVQAASGLLSAQLEPDAHPRSTTMLLLDPLTGYFAYSSILAALYQRERTGVGQRLDVAMIDAALMIASIAIANEQIPAPPPPTPPGASIVGRPTVGRFQAADRGLWIAAVLPAWWGRVCDAIGRPELKDDPRFATPAQRFANADALMVEWEAGLKAHPAEHWEAELSAIGVPAAVVRTIGEFARHPHVTQRALLSEVRTPTHPEPVRLMGAGVRFEHGGPAFQGDVPALGAHTDEVLAEIAELRPAAAL
jgi:CoA:oxalate CoA-transferase